MKVKNKFIDNRKPQSLIYIRNAIMLVDRSINGIKTMIQHNCVCVSGF